MIKAHGIVLLVYVPFLMILVLISFMNISIVNGDISNNTSSIYNNTHNNTSIYGDNSSSYNRVPDTYKVFVDGYHGFYRVYSVNTGEELIGEEYEDKTINIRVGDIVIWSNEDPTETFTITSEPRLWSNKTGYLRSAKKFNYTFNQAGMYDIYIMQRNTFPHQTVIVESLNITSNRTTMDIARDNAINKTIIFKKKGNQSTNSTSAQKSKVTIKIYRKINKVPGFEVILIIPIIITVYILNRKK